MSERALVYLDHNATTPLDPRVHAAMEPWLHGSFGNASSRDHRWGWDAAEAVEVSRGAIATLAGAPASGVVFTSGATEALNLVVRGYVGLDRWSHKKVIAVATEHEAVLAPCRFLCAQTGVRLEVLPVDRQGHVVLSALERALAGTSGALVACMAANNEIGTIHFVREFAAIVHAAGGTVLCDTTQAFGKMTVDLAADEIDYAAISAHKLYGPKGSGALLVRRRDLRESLQPLILGGGQEGGLRGGTLNVPGIAGLGEAARLATKSLAADVPRMRALRDSLEEGILAELTDVWVNGDRVSRLCNTSNLGFGGIDARGLIRDMDDVAVSSRSACSSGAAGPSHVLKAIGLGDGDAYASVRFSLGRITTREEIDCAVEKVIASVHKLRRSRSVRA